MILTADSNNYQNKINGELTSTLAKMPGACHNIFGNNKIISSKG